MKAPKEYTEGMTEWYVTLHEDKGDKFRIIFECWADDADHAEEQAVNAYPNCEIIHVIPKQ